MPCRQRRLLRHDAQPAQDRDALLDGGRHHLTDPAVLFRQDVAAQPLDPDVCIVLAFAVQHAAGDELDQGRGGETAALAGGGNRARNAASPIR